MSPKTTGRITKHEIKQDKFVSWVFYMTEQIQNYKRVVLGTIGGIAVAVILVMLVLNHQRAQKAEVQELFGRASVEIRSGNASLAIIDLRKILDEHGGSDLAGLACYYLANAYYTQRDFNEAENLYRRFLDDYGDDQFLVIASHGGIAGCLEQKAEFAAASDEYCDAAQIDLESIMAGTFLFAAVRTACEAADSSRAMRAYELIQEYYADDPQVVDPARLFLYEHRYLPPPIE